MNRGLPRMLEFGKLRLQVLHDLYGHLVAHVAWLGTLHAIHLALARHAVRHHVDMRHVVGCVVCALLVASGSLIQSNGKAGFVLLVAVSASRMHR